MNRPHRINPWVAAVVAWVLATGLVTAVYAAWLKSRGQAMRWDLAGEAALFAIPLALFLAWRERRRRG